MATNALGLIPELRPLRLAGVTNLFLEDLSTGVEEVEPVAFNGVVESFRQSSGDVRKEERSEVTARLPGGVKRVETEKSFKKPVKERGSNLEPQELLPLERWPDPWRAYFSTMPKRPKILWSYEELGRDLSGDLNPKRKELLLRLLKDINLPKGSHGFWPLRLFPDEALPEENAKIFISGAQRLAPEWVIFMTGTMPTRLGLSNVCPFVPEIAWGRYVLLTPHIDDICQSEGRYSQLICFLKSRFFS